MRQGIETAPRDGSAIILEDDGSGTYDVAHWSPEAGEWVGENGAPIKITPSHWFPLPVDKYRLHEDEGSSAPSRAGPSAWRARRYSFFPFSLRSAAPQRPTTSDAVAPGSVPLAAPVTVAAVEAQTAPVEAKRTSHARQGFATSSIAAALVAAALIGVYFRAEVSAYVTQYAGLQDIFGVSAIGGQVVAQETGLPSQDPRKTELLALQQQAEADQARAQAGAQEAAQVKQAVEASAPEARQSLEQSLEKEQRAEVLTNDVAEARGAIDRPNLQLPAKAAQTAELPGQEREQTATLTADDEAVQLKQTVESALAEARQSLEKEQRAEVLTNDVAEARGAIDRPNPQLPAEAAQTAQLPGQERGQTATLMQDATAARRELTASTPTAPPDRSAQGGDNWIISETTSPVDYTPIVTATTSSRGGSNGSSMRLSIYCRGGRTELVVAGPAVSRSGGDYAISYRINDDRPVQLAARSPSFGTGAAFTGDVIRLLQSLPEEGHVAVRISTRSGAAQDGDFLLGGLKTAREKLATACKWPHVVARPRT
jgi:hypothetical protein